jgi:hypothetical protein
LRGRSRPADGRAADLSLPAEGQSRPRSRSLADYEHIIFGGDDPEMAIGSSLRWMLPLDVQIALRDAEKDLSSWRNSPLRCSRRRDARLQCPSPGA